MKKLAKKKYLLFALVTSITLFHSCNNNPVLSELTNSRIKMIVKGTYESNSPYPHNTTLYEDDYGSDQQPFTKLINFTDIKMYLDIAEIRIATGTGFPLGTDAKDYWKFFARERILLCSDYSALFSKELKTCKSNDGATKLSQFFEEGFSYPVLDLEATTYRHLAIYIRKFVSSPAAFYDATTALVSTQPKGKFDQRQLDATDISSFYQSNPSESIDVNSKLFPLERTDLSLVVPAGDDSYVLEVRIFMKNLFMTHNQTNETVTAANELRTLSFVGISDWLYNFSYKDTTISATNGKSNFSQMGGNILMTARIYEPKKVATITITSDSGTSGPSNPFYAVMKAGTTFATSTLPLAATQATLPASITNLPIGQNYDIYKTCDSSFYDSTGVNTSNNKDGFPETKSVICASNVALATAGETISLTLPASCNCL